jgi:hypothetical protein
MVVLAVITEPVSVSISLFSPSLQGIWPFSAQSLEFSTAFSLQKQSLAEEFPTHLISEFLSVCRDQMTRNREFRASIVVVIRERIVVMWEAIVVMWDAIVVIRYCGGAEREAIVATGTDCRLAIGEC